MPTPVSSNLTTRYEALKLVKSSVQEQLAQLDAFQNDTFQSFDINFYYEALGRISRSGNTFYESLLANFVTNECLTNFETLKSIASSSQNPYEALKGINVQVTSFYETLLNLKANGQVDYTTLGPFIDSLILCSIRVIAALDILLANTQASLNATIDSEPELDIDVETEPELEIEIEVDPDEGKPNCP